MITYVTKDRERAEGMIENGDYSIVSGGGESTLEILQKVSLPKNSEIVVFKNTIQIEEVIKEKGWKLLNPSAELAEKIENKITQVAWLDELTSLLPPHKVSLTKNISWKKTPFILQWAHSHTGAGTFLINSEKDLVELQTKFPEREARATDYIPGSMFTANIVVAKDKILVGNMSYQITGIPPFTDNPFSTIGNDWSVPQSILTETRISEFAEIAQKIGKKLQNEKWKGLFGIDVIYDEEHDCLFLIEINARQPASTTYESQLQMKARDLGVPGITTFEAHLAALTDTPITEPLVEINDGAQIIQRVTTAVKNINAENLEKVGYKVITYNNTKINGDLLRIQSERGIMEGHMKFNKRGKEIENLLSE